MQRTTHLAAASFAIERVRNRQCVRIGLEHRTQRGTLAVERSDAIEIGLGDAARRKAARLHAILELCDGGFFEREHLELSERQVGQQGAGDGEGSQLGELTARDHATPIGLESHRIDAGLCYGSSVKRPAK